jgi:polyisoprenoid-binding protein YceI
MLKRKAVAIVLAAGLHLAAHADSFSIDPTHTYAYFSVSHDGFSTLRGSFDKCRGKVTLDRAARIGAVDITIETASLHTGNEMRDEHLRSANFFNATEFPVITYKSSSMKFRQDEPVSVEGDLTISGVTRPVALTIDAFKCGILPWSKKYSCGADASARIRRSDFGISYDLPGVGDDIKLEFEVEANRD